MLTQSLLISEIPLFHVINARITFSNIQALDTPVQGVTSLQEDSGRSSVAMDDAVFEVPREYEVLGGSSENTMRMYNQGNDEEEIMLQYAIRQSLGEPETSESSEQVAGLIILQKVQKKSILSKKHLENIHP